MSTTSIKVPGFCYFLVACLMLLLPINAAAAKFEKVDSDQIDFLLLDFKLQQRRISLATEAFSFKGQTLVPVSELLTTLGAGITIDVKSGSITYANNGKTFTINLINGQGSERFTLLDTPYYWTSDDYELYLSHIFLEQLISGTINVDLADLSLDITSNNVPFPIEKQWQRQYQIVSTIDKSTKSEIYIADTYQLLTPPTANVQLNLNAAGKASDTDYTAGFSIQSASDILYHSAKISLFEDSKSDKLTSRINFSRQQPSPNQTLFAGLREYNFGDISVGSNSLLNNVDSGVGFAASRRAVNYNREFGKQTIEGDATPGWELELYRNGFLIEQAVVPDNGHYSFNDVATEYGVNNFEVRLFGPFGEEQIRTENINIGYNWLAQGDFGYDFYVLKPNETLLSHENIADNHHQYGFSFDYSIFDSTQIGTFFQSFYDRQNAEQQYLGAHIQSSLNNLQLDINATHQIDQGFSAEIRGVGRFPWGNNYDFQLKSNDNFSSDTTAIYNTSYLARFSTSGAIRVGRGLSYRTTFFNASNGHGDRSWGFSPSLSGRIANTSISNLLQYQVVTSKHISTSTEQLTGNLNLSSRIGAVRISAAANYALYPYSHINSINTNLSWQHSNTSHHYLNANYQPQHQQKNINEKWDVTYIYSANFDQFQLNLSSSYDNENQWDVGIGISFFIDYDAHNRKFLFDHATSSATGNFNITSYLDRNSNNRHDEGDWALSDVSFSPLPIWQDLTTNQMGRVSLPGVPVSQPFTFNASAVDGIQTKQPSFTIYTHPGSRIDLEIPFEIVTHVSGFVVVMDQNLERPLTVGSIILTNVKTLVQTTEYLDFDGFFEFNNISPGAYTLQVASSDLARLKLMPAAGVISFTTPTKGGFYELSPLMLVPIGKDKQRFPASSTIQLNNDNGEAYYFADMVNNNNIYAATQGQKASSNNEETFAAKTPEKQKSVTNQQTTLLENQQQLTKIDSPELASSSSVSPENVVKYYTLQMGAFSQVANAQLWIAAHNKIANCAITASANLNVVRCGRFHTRYEANQFADNIKQLNPSQSILIKQRNGAVTTSYAQSSSYFTLQLLVAANDSTIAGFTSVYQLATSDITITTKSIDGRQLKFVSMGNYTNKTQAQAALSNLSATLQRIAWIKRHGRP